MGDMRIASIRFKMHDHQEIVPRIERLARECKDILNGPPMSVYDYGLGTARGIDTEVCFPVTEPFEKGEIKSRILAGGEALTILHRGSHDTLKDSWQRLWGYFRGHGLPGTATQREIYYEYHPEEPEKNVTELQAFIHDWENRLAENVERVLGGEARKEAMKGVEEITPESSIKKRTEWINGAMERLNRLASERQRYDIVSNCAHVFSDERIEELKAVWERTHDIDELLDHMRNDPDGWYANPIRKDNVIYVKKKPLDQKAFDEAKTEEEKRRAFCHCPMVRNNIEEMNPTFCWCGAGWYRQYWEGILGRPVKMEFLRSLTRGDDACELAIHLPIEIKEGA